MLVAELDVDLEARGIRAAGSLTIAEIETIAIRVPLAQTYRGSALQDDAPLDDRDADPHRGRDRRGGLLRRRGRGAARDR